MSPKGIWHCCQRLKGSEKANAVLAYFRVPEPTRADPCLGGRQRWLLGGARGAAARWPCARRARRPSRGPPG